MVLSEPERSAAIELRHQVAERLQHFVGGLSSRNRCLDLDIPQLFFEIIGEFVSLHGLELFEKFGIGFCPGVEHAVPLLFQLLLFFKLSSEKVINLLRNIERRLFWNIELVLCRLDLFGAERGAVRFAGAGFVGRALADHSVADDKGRFFLLLAEARNDFVHGVEVVAIDFVDIPAIRAVALGGIFRGVFRNGAVEADFV